MDPVTDTTHMTPIAQNPLYQEHRWRYQDVTDLTMWFLENMEDFGTVD